MTAPRLRRSRRPLAVAVVALVLAGLVAAFAPASAAPVASVDDRGTANVNGRKTSSFTLTKELTRVFTNADDAVYPFAQATRWRPAACKTCEPTRGRRRPDQLEGVPPSGGWAAKPSGRTVSSRSTPVVIMQCRGRDDASLSAEQQLRPETCWTGSVAQRSQITRSDGEATWTHDLYADPSAKERVSGIVPFPTTDVCPVRRPGALLHPADALRGEVREGVRGVRQRAHATRGRGRRGLPAGRDRSLHRLHRLGQRRVRDAQRRRERVARAATTRSTAASSSSRSTGCPATRPPIRPRSRTRPAARVDGFRPARATSPTRASTRRCPRRCGGPLPTGPTGSRSRSPSACRPTPATSSTRARRPASTGPSCWPRRRCSGRRRTAWTRSASSSSTTRCPTTPGFNLMESGGGAAAVVSSEHERRGDDPVAYAPTAVTGFSIGYVIDRPDNAGELTDLRLNARLIAKLITQSYLGSDLGRGHPGIGDNPLGDHERPRVHRAQPGPEPDLPGGGRNAVVAVELHRRDRAAHGLHRPRQGWRWTFVNGKADQWGMKVNPNYKKIKLPRAGVASVGRLHPTHRERLPAEQPCGLLHASSPRR